MKIKFSLNLTSVWLFPLKFKYLFYIESLIKIIIVGIYILQSYKFLQSFQISNYKNF